MKVICAAVSSSELSLFFGHLLFSLALDPVQDDLQHYLTPMTDEAAALSFSANTKVLIILYTKFQPEKWT